MIYLSNLTLFLIGSFLICALVTGYLLHYYNATKFYVCGKHVVITGGSMGLGLCLAKEMILLGAKVSIIAR